MNGIYAEIHEESETGSQNLKNKQKQLSKTAEYKKHLTHVFNMS